LSKLQDVLDGWAKELSGIGVCYRQAFLEFKGNLYDQIGTDGKLKEKPIEQMVKEPGAEQIARGLRQAIQRLYLGTNSYPRFRWEAVEAEYGRPLDEFGRWVVGRLKGNSSGVTARPAGDGAEIEIVEEGAAPSAPAPGTVNQASSPQELVLSTGCPELNRLLRMGGRPEEKPGILVAAQGAEEPETPVVLIEGQEGTGKTTLALQMAHAALKEGDGCFSVFFYSLEQPASSLRRLAAAFNFAGEDRVWLWDFRDEHEGATRPEPAKSVYLCHLSPLPIRDVPPKPILEARLAEIVHMLERASGLSPGRKPVFFLDSLNALGMSPLERNDVHRLFAMFRSKKIPLVVTSERYATRPEDVPASLEHARFLADVVVSLSREGSGDYQQFYLEILKSRQSRQAFGRHLYKIRTQESALRTSLDPRRGIVVYPSIHSVLSRAWSPPGESGQPAEKRFWVGDDKKDPASNEYLDELLNVVEEPTIKAGACIAIVGPTGTHKLALGMNLAMGNDGTDEGNPKVLVVTFGGSGEIKFEGVAWATTRAALGRELKPVQSAEGGVATALGFEQRKVKFWKRLYTAEATRGQQARRADVTVLAFRVGELAPEECFYVLEKEVKDGGYSSVLLSDTAVLCTGFPLLRDDPVFMAALLDFFEAKGLVSVAIGVEAPQVPKSYELNFALMAKADYRIVLSHYPTVYALAKRIVGGRARSKAQQLSSLVIDNVVGKHYGRELRWLWVEENLKPPEKTLHCGTEPPRAACEQLGLAANSTPQGSAGPSG
jgi:KaiC/GvpD/RAD55 family RecA-like ATPase